MALAHACMCTQISVTFKNQQVLKDCSWEVKKGERVGLVGEWCDGHWNAHMVGPGSGVGSHAGKRCVCKYCMTPGVLCTVRMLVVGVMVLQTQACEDLGAVVASAQSLMHSLFKRTGAALHVF